MIYLFNKFIKNKYFILFVILFLILLYLIFNPIMGSKMEYMDLNNITDNIYLYFVYILPFTFYNNATVSCLILDLSYFCIISYIGVYFVNYFFEDTATITLTRKDRNKWIKDIFKCIIIFATIISIIYSLYFLILCIFNTFIIKFKIDLLIIIIYKILISIILSLTYILFYIKIKDILISLGFSYIISILYQLLIKITFLESTLYFKYPIIIILLLIISIILIFNYIKIVFKRSDVS